MTWVRLDDRFPSHRKALQAGPLGRDLYVCMLCYCNLHKTDGVVPKEALASIAPGLSRPVLVASRLVLIGFLEEKERSYVVHDYLKWNRSREEIEAIVEKKRQSGRIGGQRSGESRRKQTRSKRTSAALEANEANAEALSEPISSPTTPYSPPTQGDEASASQNGLRPPPPGKPYNWRLPMDPRDDWREHPREAFRFDCPEGKWRGRCVRPDFDGPKPADTRQCPAHRTQEPAW